jgi:RNA polymerase sigma-70 factor (ECF subfamily)
VLSEKELAAFDGVVREPAPTYSQLGRMADEELMELVKQGNHDAFANLFDRYYRLVLSIALRILRDQAEAEDLMQDVFFDFFKDAKSFDQSKGRFKHWLFSRAYRRSYNRLEYLSVRRFYAPTESLELEHLPAGDSESRWNDLNRQECRRVIEQGLATLSDRQRAIIEMACFQGKSMSEIAAAVNESVANVRNHYYRGLKKLKVFLQGGTYAKGKLAGVHMEGTNLEQA